MKVKGKKNRSHPVDEKNDVSAKPNNSSHKSCILAFNMSWHRPRKYLWSFILHYINFCADSFIFEHYFCSTLFFPIYWAAVVLFWCFTWRCFLSLRLKCDCVVYRAGFLLSHVKKENKRFGDRSNRFFKDRRDQRIICKPADYAAGPTNEEWDRLRLSAPHAQSHHSPWGNSLYKPHRYRETPL